MNKQTLIEQTSLTSAQRVELYAVIMVFEHFPSVSLNLFSDSKYRIDLLLLLETATIGHTNDPELSSSFRLLQQLIRSHDGPVAGLYIRAHSNLPGPLTKLNATADVLTRSKRDLYPVHFPPKNRVEVTPPPQSLFPKAGHVPIYRTPLFRLSCCQEWLMYCIHYLHTVDTHGPCPGHPHIMVSYDQTASQAAQQLHALHRQSAATLHTQFSLTGEAAPQIVKQCPQCLPHLPVPHYVVNPRGLLPRHLWQMDVTHIPSFGKLQFVHVTIDTYSGFLCATAQTGEATKHVITHLLHCFAFMNLPKIIKTDNGPAAFATFCSSLQNYPYYRHSI